MLFYICVLGKTQNFVYALNSFLSTYEVNIKKELFVQAFNSWIFVVGLQPEFDETLTLS